jgi:hypothetical protein
MRQIIFEDLKANYVMYSLLNDDYMDFENNIDHNMSEIDNITSTNDDIMSICSDTSSKSSIMSDIKNIYLENLVEYEDILYKIGEILEDNKETLYKSNIYSKDNICFDEQIQLASSIIKNYVSENILEDSKTLLFSITAFNISDKLLNDDHISLLTIIQLCNNYCEYYNADLNIKNIKKTELILLKYTKYLSILKNNVNYEEILDLNQHKIKSDILINIASNAFHSQIISNKKYSKYHWCLLFWTKRMVLNAFKEWNSKIYKNSFKKFFTNKFRKMQFKFKY